MYSEVDFTKIGVAIKMLRTRKHIPQRYLAELIGVSQTHMSNIESGRVQINLRLMAKMADVFGCRLDDFFSPSRAFARAGRRFALQRRRFGADHKIAAAAG